MNRVVRYRVNELTELIYIHFWNSGRFINKREGNNSYIRSLKNLKTLAFKNWKIYFTTWVAVISIMALDIWPIEASMTAPLSHGVDYLWNELKAHTKLVRAETYSVHEISSEFTRPIGNYLAASPRFSYQPITHDGLITFCSISRSLSADKSVDLGPIGKLLATRDRLWVIERSTTILPIREIV